MPKRTTRSNGSASASKKTKSVQDEVKPKLKQTKLKFGSNGDAQLSPKKKDVEAKEEVEAKKEVDVKDEPMKVEEKAVVDEEPEAADDEPKEKKKNGKSGKSKAPPKLDNLLESGWYENSKSKVFVGAHVSISGNCPLI